MPASLKMAAGHPRREQMKYPAQAQHSGQKQVGDKISI